MANGIIELSRAGRARRGALSGVPQRCSGEDDAHLPEMSETEPARCRFLRLLRRRPEKECGPRRRFGPRAGQPAFSNVPEGARLACEQKADLVIFEGSGAANPPVRVDSIMLVVSATQPREYVLGYLGPYRLLRSDLVVVTMCDDFLVSSDSQLELIGGIQAVNPEVKVLRTVFRPRPLGEVEGRRLFLASTAPPRAVEAQCEHLEREFGAVVVGSSPNLADRKKLSADLERARDAEVLATELKAAGVDTVSARAESEGKELVYIENVPVALEGGLEEEIENLERITRDRFAGRGE